MFFQLPIFPPFWSPTLIFFFTIDFFFAEKCFQFEVLIFIVIFKLTEFVLKTNKSLEIIFVMFDAEEQLNC